VRPRRRGLADKAGRTTVSPPCVSEDVMRNDSMNPAISGSILAEPEACFVVMMALPLGST
jgi:hypothetical protein